MTDTPLNPSVGGSYRRDKLGRLTQLEAPASFEQQPPEEPEGDPVLTASETETNPENDHEKEA